MKREKERLYEDVLSPMGQKIDLVSNQLVDNANKLVFQGDVNDDEDELLDESDELEKQLEFLKRSYSIVDGLPEWPFNKRTVMTFLSSQGVPLLGLTGIGSNLLEVIKSFLKI